MLLKIEMVGGPLSGLFTQGYRGKTMIYSNVHPILISKNLTLN